MNELVSLAFENLTSPVLLFFLLGVLAATLRSDLEIPPAIGKALSLYLMIAIGFKGGLALAATDIWTLRDAALATAAILVSLLMPWLAYWLLKKTTRLSDATAAATGAAYGSVSVVTFVTAAAFLTRQGIAYQGHLVAILALMEAPAIVAGILLARRALAGSAPREPVRPGLIVREALVSGSVLVLLGALVIGWLTGERGMAAVGGVLVSPFQGILAIFLLEMGLIVVRRLRESPIRSWRLIAFGIYMPLLGALLGALVARALGLSAGNGALFIVLAASASYIAVPAAMRHALPEADPGVYVTLSLAVTFPFNVIVGIPAYVGLARTILT